jgi:hypothetical protein
MNLLLQEEDIGAPYNKNEFQQLTRRGAPTTEWV